MANYVIADVHGCPQTLKALVQNQIELKPNDTLYLLGDYIDRGPDSKGVLDLLLGWIHAGYKVTALLGNHEDMLLKVYFGEPWRVYQHLKLYEGLSLLDENDTLDLKYLNYMRSMPKYLALDKFYLVHAGFNFALANPLVDEEAMLWIRKPVPNLEWLAGRQVIHGHQPFGLATIKEQVALGAPLLPLDNGAVYHLTAKSPDLNRYGNLCALHLETMQLLIQPNFDNFDNF